MCFCKCGNAYSKELSDLTFKLRLTINHLIYYYLHMCQMRKITQKFSLESFIVYGIAEFEITVGHWPFSDQYCYFGLAKSDCYIGQIYCTFPMGKPLIVFQFLILISSSGIAYAELYTNCLEDINDSSNTLVYA